MRDALFGFVNGSVVASSKRKSRTSKRRDQWLAAACIEGLESRFLLSSAVQVEGSIPAGNGYVNAGTLTPITSGEVAPNATTFTDFGPTTTGTALTRTYTITNTGNTTLNLSAMPIVTLTGDTTDFSVSTQPGSPTIAPGLSENLTITYTPSAAGEQNATVDIASDDPLSPFTFEIQADNLTTTSQSGVQISTTGNGTGSAAANGQLLVMTYDGFLTNGDEFDTSANHGGQFQFTLGSTAMGQTVIQGWDNGLLGMQVGQARTMVIPSAQGYGVNGSPPGIPANANLIFTTTLVDIISIAGKVGGSNVAIASTETTPAVNNATDFGAIAPITHPPVTNTYVISDVAGNLGLELSNPQVTIAGSPAFTVTQPVIAGGTGTFTVTYTPSVGTTNATLTLNTTTGAAQFAPDFEVQAEGPANAAAPQISIIGDNSSATTAITSGEASPTQASFTDFGMTAADGTLPVMRTYTITNNGNSTLDLSGGSPVVISGDTADFTVTAQPATTVAQGGGSTTFTIQYTPTGGNATTDTATVSIGSDAANSPFTFEIQGEGVPTAAIGSLGLQTGTISAGSGAATSQAGELMVVNYTGFLTDGTKFDSSLNAGRSPLQFVLGAGQVIQGWDQGLVGMKVGEQRLLLIPPSLGYGVNGNPPSIPANAALIFSVSLLNIVSLSGVVSGTPQPITSGETSPTQTNGTDFGNNFPLISSPSKTETFEVSVPSGTVSTYLAANPISVSGSSAFTVTQPVFTGTEAMFTVKYTPSVGTTNATVTIANSTGSNNEKFEVQAEGPATANVSQITVKGNNSGATSPIATGETSPSQATWTDFGPTSSGGLAVPVTRQYTITNSGNATLDLTGPPLVSISGDTTDFTVTIEPSATVTAGGTTNFTVQFKPTTAGTKTATVTIASNDPNGPFTFEIQGEALATTAGANGLQTFTTGTGTGAAAANGELLIINYTGYLLDGTKFDSSLNAGRSPFQFVLGQGSVIQGWDKGLLGMQVGQSRTLIVPAALAYGAAGNGSVPANAVLIFTTTLLNIVSVSGGSSVLIPSGESIASANNGTDFGTHLLTDAPVTNTYTLSCVSGSLSALLTGTAITIAGSPAFTVTQPVIASGASTGTFTVTYAPTKGESAAAITIHNVTASQPNLVFGVQATGPIPANSGTGPKITVIGDNEFASIPILSGSTATNAQQIWTNFGSSAVGGSVTVTRTYTIANAGTSTLNLLGGSPVTISGEGAADFSVTAQPSATIAAGASSTFTISFLATAPGARGATVTINSNDSANPFTFLIAGTGLVVTTGTDGLQTATTIAGTGPVSQNGDLMVMNYSGFLTDGTEFDSSLFPTRTPFQFTLGKQQVIKGWDEGLVGVQVGESRTLIIPASLAYGSSGQGSIPPNATLIFTVTVVNIISVSGVVNSSDVFIPSGDNTPSTTDGTDFGFVAGNGTAVMHNFVITAPGGNLNTLLAANPVSLSGSGASVFTLSQPVFNAGFTQATFTITYPPGSTGTSTALVSINNAAMGSPNVTFNVQGEGPTGSDGSISVANTDQITGFAYNPTSLGDTLNIKLVFDGGLLTQTIPANQNNSDVQTLTGSPDHGFDYAMPMMTVGTHTVSISAVDPQTGTTTLLGTRQITSQNSLFDENYYLMANPDVAAAVAAGTIASGYDHYIQFGQFEGRSPSPYWNEKYYLAKNPDVAAAVAAGRISSGFMHYYLYGQYENRPGLVYFNQTYYLQNNTDVAAAISPNGAITSAFEHFSDYGQYEDRAPMLYFSSTVYDAHNTDILPYIDGEPFSSDFEHYVLFGQYEGRTASNFFNEQTYLADNPDVAAAVRAGIFPDGLQHWLEYGQYEHRTA